MNPIKQIGRYQLPILSVIATCHRNKSGWRKYAFWRRPGFDALLADGHRIHFTAKEKETWDREIIEHDKIMQVYGMCKGMGLRG